MEKKENMSIRQLSAEAGASGTYPLLAISTQTNGEQKVPTVAEELPMWERLTAFLQSLAKDEKPTALTPYQQKQILKDLRRDLNTGFFDLSHLASYRHVWSHLGKTWDTLNEFFDNAESDAVQYPLLDRYLTELSETATRLQKEHGDGRYAVLFANFAFRKFQSNPVLGGWIRENWEQRVEFQQKTAKEENSESV